MKSIFTRFAIWWTMRKPATKLIPRSGPRTVGLNCFEVHIRSRESDLDVLVEGILPEGVSGQALFEFRFQNECIVSWQNLKGLTIEFTNYIGPYEFRYTNVLRFLISEILGLFRYIIYRNKIEQFFFNRRRLAITEQMEALRMIIDRTINDPQYRTSPMAFIADIYSQRVISHPDFDRLNAYTRLLLDSLVQSGDLRIDNGMYVLEPTALVSLSQYEVEERKHHDTIRQQCLLGWLTFALVLVGIVQLIVAYFKDG